ncbi:Ig-like domain-containing protein [Vibrio sp. Makdt]|uniref:Ig-like domain-containing protein n=1 Tax=Vibrio sp. Makdt TaxID=2998828 RepID=UPI0022CD98C1|nr:Ig-like domain-containing protein [Vibrio sp. Makdt]MDA0152150.1 Ig-like domain-containing protein [Vibrio sp. Makdt]
MRRILALAALAAAAGCANAAMVDLGTWKQEGSPANGTWSLSADRHSVFQSINGHPTAYVSDQSYDYRVFRGDIKVETSSDDDYIGFVVSYSDSEFIIFDWKKADQGTAKKGYSLIHSRGSLDQLKTLGWDIHEGNTSLTTLLARDRSKGWTHNQYYNFQVQLKPGRVIASVDDKVIFDVETEAVKPGRFGFINWSQSHVRYHSIQELHPPIPADIEMDVDQGKVTRITGSWTDGNTDETHTCRLVNQPDHGKVTFVPPCSFDYQPMPDKNGTQNFEYAVLDSNGIEAEGDVTLHVLASGLNAALPSHLIASKSYAVNVEIGGQFSDGFVKPNIMVENSPSFLSYDDVNSRIIMTPSVSDLGVHSDIRITAVNSNGNRVSLGAFDLQVIPSDKDDYLTPKFTLLPSQAPLLDSDDNHIVSVELPPLASGENNLVEGPHEMIVTTDNSPETVVIYDGLELAPGSTNSFMVDIIPTGTVIPFAVHAPEPDNAGFSLELPWIDSPDDLRYVKAVACGPSDSTKCRNLLESDRLSAPSGEIQVIFRDYDTKEYTTESFSAADYASSLFMGKIASMSDKDMFSININTGSAASFLNALQSSVGDSSLSNVLASYSGKDAGTVVYVHSKGVIDSKFDGPYRWGTSTQTWVGLDN